MCALCWSNLRQFWTKRSAYNRNHFDAFCYRWLSFLFLVGVVLALRIFTVLLGLSSTSTSTIVADVIPKVRFAEWDWAGMH